MANASRGEWSVRYVLVLLAIAGLTAIGAHWFDRYAFNPVTTESITSLLTPLFVIALFLERGLEVFVSAWRDIDLDALESKSVAAYRAGTTRTGGPRSAPSPSSRVGVSLSCKWTPIH
jgi:hypothetical protein